MLLFRHLPEERYTRTTLNTNEENKKVAADQYIIVAGIINVMRQSASKNMNEHA